jgi:hypothetical protein
LFEKISGNDHFVAIQISLNRWIQGYFLAVVGFLIFAFFELDEYLIRSINLVKAHEMTISLPFISSCGLLVFAIYGHFDPQEENDIWRRWVVVILFFILLYFLMRFYLKIPGLDVLENYIQ